MFVCDRGNGTFEEVTRATGTPGLNVTSVSAVFLNSKVDDRRGRDSNPRYTFAHTGFRNQLLQPLGHLSSVGIMIPTGCAAATTLGQDKLSGTRLSVKQTP